MARFLVEIQSRSEGDHTIDIRREVVKLTPPVAYIGSALRHIAQTVPMGPECFRLTVTALDGPTVDNDGGDEDE